MSDSGGPWRQAELSDGSKYRTARLRDGSEVTLASGGERLAARAIDFGISVGFLLLIGLRLWWSVASWSFDNSLGPLDEWQFIWLPALPLALGVIYRIATTAFWGQTLGKRALRIRVVDASTGQRPRWRQAVVRTAATSAGGFVSLAGLSFWFVLSIVSASTGGAVFFLIAGFLMVISCCVSLTWHAQRQGWHDSAAGTLVVKGQ